MKNQNWTTALLTLVLPILGACSSPATLEINTATTGAGSQIRLANAWSLPNDTWTGSFVGQPGFWDSPTSKFSTTLPSGLRVQIDLALDLGNGSYGTPAVATGSTVFDPGGRANTLVSRAFDFTVNGWVKFSGSLVRGCSYSISPQTYHVPAGNGVLEFDLNSIDMVKRDIEFSAHGEIDLLQLNATVTQVCPRSTAVSFPVVLTRNVQPTWPKVLWLNNYKPITGRPLRAPLDLIHFLTSNYPNGGATFDRILEPLPPAPEIVVTPTESQLEAFIPFVYIIDLPFCRFPLECAEPPHPWLIGNLQGLKYEIANLEQGASKMTLTITAMDSAEPGLRDLKLVVMNGKEQLTAPLQIKILGR
jgi:hypothetical protein